MELGGSRPIIVSYATNDETKSLLINLAFNAALAVFSGLLIQANGIAGPMTAGLETEDLRTSLYLAVEALQNLGGGARLVQRCRKYLETLVRVAATTKGKFPFSFFAHLYHSQRFRWR